MSVDPNRNIHFSIQTRIPQAVIALYSCVWVLSASAKPTPSTSAEPTTEKLFTFLGNVTIQVDLHYSDYAVLDFLISQIQIAYGSTNFLTPNFHVSEITYYRSAPASLNSKKRPEKTVNLSIKEALDLLLSRSSMQLIVHKSDWYFIPAAIKIDQSVYTKIAPNVYLFKEHSTPARQDTKAD